MFRTTPATLVLIAVNCVFFLLTYAYAGAWTGPLWTSALVRLGAQFNPYTLGGEWYRLFSHMFLHGHAIHLLVNMLALFSAGREIESAVGSRKFLFLYFICGIGSALTSLYWSLFTVGVGASGAIFGLFGFSLVLNLISGHREGRSLTPMLINFVVFIFINIAVGEAFHADHAAHFGGLTTGALVALASVYLQRDPRTVRAEYFFLILLLAGFFILPRYQVTYHRFFKEVVKAEKEGKEITTSTKSDSEFLKRLQFNNAQWDTARTLLSSLTYVPDELHKDTLTLSRYVYFRHTENDYKIRMIRDETYILMDSLSILQDSIRKYLQLEHPVPLNFTGAVDTPADSVSDEVKSKEPAKFTRVWYDSNWVEVQEPSVYYRIGYRDSIDRWQGPVRDFYADGKVQMKGEYKDDRRHGIFLYYSHHDTYTSAGRYLDNRSVGKWQLFHNNGKIKSEIVYGQKVFYKNIWDSAGVQHVTNGAGKITEYFSGSAIRSEGEYVNGSMEGIWMGWYENGDIHYREEYREGFLIHGRSRDPRGNEYIYDRTSLVPVPAGGYQAFENYLEKAASRNGGIGQGTVKIFFRVTAKGTLVDFEIERSASREMDKEAIRILQDGPEWKPARLHGYIPTDGYAWADVVFEVW
jgi:membrane associated rhomboid family serine protease/antitoxin component YwqK of YwqJK toxin-antitoxin module